MSPQTGCMPYYIFGVSWEQMRGLAAREESTCESCNERYAGS